jgi:trans-aconitate methyltransferase
MGLFAGLGCGFMGCFMVYDSKVGKIRERDRLLDLVPWRGTEAVLDLGCGRGLMLIGAARRLTTGRATGLDREAVITFGSLRPDIVTARAAAA